MRESSRPSSCSTTPTPTTPLSLPIPQRPIRVTTNTRTPGLAGARNSGITESTGELIAFCDDDDSWRPDKLAHQVDVLTRQRMTDFVIGSIDVAYDGKVTRRTPPSTELRFEDLLRSRVMEAHPSTFVIRRSLFDEIGLVDEHIPGSYAEDYELLLRAARKAPIGVAPDSITRVLWHPTSFFADGWRNRIDALEYLLDLYPEFENEPSGLARIEGQLAFANAAIGGKKRARSLAGQAIRRCPTEKRAYLALLVSLGLFHPDTVVRYVQRLGRGI